MQKYVVASWSARACVVECIYRASQIQLCLKSAVRGQPDELTSVWRGDRPPYSIFVVSTSSSILSSSVGIFLEQAIIADWRGELDGETHSSSSL